MMAAPEVDTKAGVSTMCRGDHHAICVADACSCSCHHGFRTPKVARAATPTKKAATQAFLARNGNRAAAQALDKPLPIGGGARVRRANGSGKPKPRPPVIDLVRVDPPAPAEKAKRISLAEQIRPQLEQILVAGHDDPESTAARDWYRVVLFFKAKQAGMNIKRCRDHYGTTEWDWTHAQLPEEDQSAIYVRWIGSSRSKVQL